MKTRAWMLCCIGLLFPLSIARAEEQPQGFITITVGIEGEGLERIPVVGSLLQYLVDCQEEQCCEEEVTLTPTAQCPKCANHDRGVPVPGKCRLFKNVGPESADENCETEQADCPPSECPACVVTERSVPILSKIPYVGRLFKNVGIARVTEDCEQKEVECPAAQTIRFVGPDGFERIGVNFECEAAEDCDPCQAKRWPPANTVPAVVSGAMPRATCPPPAAVCTPMASYAAAPQEVLPAPIAIMHAQAFPERDELIEALMEARVEAAVAQTALKVREESDAKQFELIKELLKSQVENAKLTAKLELASEKEKMLSQLLETHVELATLKAQVARETEVAQRKRQRKDVEARRPEEADSLR